MSTKLLALKPALRIELPGIPEPVLDDTIVRVARQFFWKSEIWKYTSDNGKDWTSGEKLAPELTPGTDTPADTAVKRVDTIKYDANGSAWDDKIPFKTRDELDRDNPDWETETGTSPNSWTIDNDGQARVVPIPTSTVSLGLLLRAIVVPNGTTATTVPDFLFFENEEVLKAGVFAQLMKQPGKDWTNIELSAVYASEYSTGIKTAKSRAEAGFGQPKDVMAYGGIQ
jgi:hypothetical protein